MSNIIDVEYSDVMSQSYIDYSMSVIVDRAVPDIRDGLKPVQRRIIYDMSKLGITSDKPYRKVARIVGDTMGKFHPHGDASIEEALVVLAQNFKKNYPLIDGHGNFGSIEGDQHAAARYIESKLTPFSENIFLSELPYKTVDMQANYDGSEEEPTILPAILPNFLINGSEGIAVGMTTSVPPHNLSEVIDGEIAYLKKPSIKVDELMKYVSGPDFPTKGIISNKNDLKEIYETGVGKIKIRGKVETETLKNGKKNLVITEIPYTMTGTGISKFLNDVASLVENRVISDITDISNQSSKEGIRIVIELRKGADATNIKNILYQKTKLEDTFGVNMLAIADGRPEVLSLCDVYKHHTSFLYNVYTKKYKYLLKKEEEHLEIQEGLIQAIDLIDLIIAVLRGSKNQKDAKACLMTGNTDKITLKTKKLYTQASKLHFTERQTDAILAMRLSRLIGLELEQLEKEKEKSKKNIDTYKKYLGNKKELTKNIISILENLKKQFKKPRGTKIENSKEIVIKKEKLKEIDIVVLIDRFGYIKTVEQSTYERNKEAADNENKYVISAKNTNNLFFISNLGKFYKVSLTDIPCGKFRDKSVPIENYTKKSWDTEERPIWFGILEDLKKEVIFGTLHGFVKKMDAKELLEIKRNGTNVIKLEENDLLEFFEPITNQVHILMVTQNGYLLKSLIKNISTKKKSARGIVGIKCKEDDDISFYQLLPKDNFEVNIQNKTINVESIKASPTGRVGKKY